MTATLGPARPAAEHWTYAEAFSRHQGLFSPTEQQVLRGKRVAIIGMGGVGGVHLITLARLGIGAFSIADPDRFEIANFNRQYGAKIENIGRPKVEAMADEARSINPDLDIRTFDAPIDDSNVEEFLRDADILVDGVDFFAIDARRLVFQQARRQQIWGITAGPHAFGTAWQAFDPRGMSFDEFFDFRDDMDEVDKIVAFAVGCCPTPLHLKYVNLKEYFRLGSRGAGSLGLACQMAAGVTASLVARIFLHRGDVRPAPCYAQFDAYREQVVRRKLRWGNRHPWQQLKRWWLKRLMSNRRQGN